MINVFAVAKGNKISFVLQVFSGEFMLVGNSVNWIDDLQA